MAKANTKTTQEVTVEETTAPKPRGRQVPTPTFTKAQRAMVTKMNTTSEKIRYLATAWKHDHNDNNCTSAISKAVSDVNGSNVRYQHVRNVLTQPLKRPVKEAVTTKS